MGFGKQVSAYDTTMMHATQSSFVHALLGWLAGAGPFDRCRAGPGGAARARRSRAVSGPGKGRRRTHHRMKMESCITPLGACALWCKQRQTKAVPICFLSRWMHIHQQKICHCSGKYPAGPGVGWTAAVATALGVAPGKTNALAPSVRRVRRNRGRGGCASRGGVRYFHERSRN